jgi:hypothetical protein
MTLPANLQGLIGSWRERALVVTLDQVKDAAEMYLAEPTSKGLTSTAVLGQINETIVNDPTWEKFDFDLSLGEEAEPGVEAMAST